MKTGTTFEPKSDEQYEQAILECYGSIKAIAQKLNISEHTVKAKIRRSPYLQQLQDTVQREKLWGLAQEAWYEALEKKEKWAVEKAIEYIGHYAGYFKSQEITTPKTPKADLKKLSDADLDKIDELLDGKQEVTIDEFATDSNENGYRSGKAK